MDLLDEWAVLRTRTGKHVLEGRRASDGRYVQTSLIHKVNRRLWPPHPKSKPRPLREGDIVTTVSGSTYVLGTFVGDAGKHRGDPQRNPATRIGIAIGIAAATAAAGALAVWAVGRLFPDKPKPAPALDVQVSGQIPDATKGVIANVSQFFQPKLPQG